MGAENKQIDGFAAWRTHTDKRLLRQERAPRFYHASDLLGPGFGPTATELLDWNADEAAFNGFFWSLADSLHSPNNAVQWAGLAIAEDENIRGVQVVWQAEPGNAPAMFVRRWDEAVDEGRSYTPWRPAAGDGGAITTKTSAYTLTDADTTCLARGTFNVRLPSAVGRTGRVYYVKNTGTGTITVVSATGQAIDGITGGWGLPDTGDAIGVQSDGADWWIISLV